MQSTLVLPGINEGMGFSLLLASKLANGGGGGRADYDIGKRRSLDLIALRESCASHRDTSARGVSVESGAPAMQQAERRSTEGIESEDNEKGKRGGRGLELEQISTY